ncbi:MAG: four helix bundle protein [Bacteroidetes bacterium]|nr:four helix bundle protein [Bacteroidota bacterium]MBU1115452.1 four helix bundle protein [Bacteroidota bacterium]MBU1798507.1 four helix bundle protein [Bacteroidota bacterium]
MHNFKELKIWQKGRNYVKEIYLTVSKFPPEEKFALTSQMKRAVISIPSNIAEGAGRRTDKDFLRFLDIANGSAFELETHIYLAYDLDFINEETLNNLITNIEEIEKMIFGFKKTLNEND